MRRSAAILLVVVFAEWAAASDPFPIRREVLPPGFERAPAGQGALIQVNRDEFERRLSSAIAATTGRDAPQIAAAQYTVRLDGTNLVGQARWTIHHAATVPTHLPLPSWGMAWRSAAWSDGEEVVASRADRGDGIRVLITKTGDRVLAVDWSLRARETPAGLLFDLRAPQCAASNWELDLPPEATAYWLDDPAALQGPKQVAGRAIWSAQAKTSSRLLIQLKPTEALVAYLMRTDDRIEVSAGLAEATIHLDLTFVGDRRRQALIGIDPNLKVTEIVGESLVDWEHDLQFKAVRLHFAGAQSHARVRLIGRTDLTSGQIWSPPTIQPVNGAADGETLVVAAAPGVEFDDWRSGALQLVSQQRRPNGWVNYSLTTTPFRADSGRPSCRPQFTKSIVDVSQHLRWRVEPNAQSLTAEVTWQPYVSPLTRSTLTPSPGWEVEAVDGLGGDAAPNWHMGTVAGRSSLELEWSSADLTPRRAMVRLRRPLSDPLGNVQLPDLMVSNVRSRQLTLDTWVSPVFDAELAPGASVMPAPVPNGPSAPSARWLGRTAPLEGRLLLRPRATHFTARGEGTITAGRDLDVIEHQIRVNPSTGALYSLLLWSNVQTSAAQFAVTAPARLATAQPLPTPSIGAWLATHSLAGTLSALGVEAVQGSWWLIRLDEPIAQPFTVTVRRELSRRTPAAVMWAGAAGGVWPTQLLTGVSNDDAVPLWTAPTAASQEHHITVADPRIRAWYATASESRAVKQVTYHDRPANLTITSAPGVKSAAAKRRLSVAWQTNGRLICRCECRLGHWYGEPIAFHLPTGASWIASKSSGKDLAASVTDGLATVVPPAADDVIVEAFFSLPAPGRWPATWIEVLPDSFQLDDIDERVQWSLPHGIVSLTRYGAPDAAPKIDWPVPTLPTHSAITAGPTVLVATVASVRFTTGVVTLAAIALTLLGWPKLAGRPGALFAAVLALAVVWLPPVLRPLVAGPLLVFLLTTAFALVRPRFVWRPTVTVGVVLAMAWPVDGAERPMTTVYVLPAFGVNPELVLVPKDLLQELDRVNRRGIPEGRAVTMSGSYRCEASADSVKIAARWQVHAFHDQAQWEFPTRGVQLADIRVNGRRAYPSFARDRCQLPLPGSGSFTVEATFTAAVTGSPEDRSFHFPVAEAPATQLNLSLPTGSVLTDSPGVGSMTKTNSSYDIDCGCVSDLHFRWRGRTEKTPGPTQQQQAWLWNLNPPSPRLIGIINVELQPNSSREMSWQLPPGLAVVSVRDSQNAALTAWTQVGTRWSVWFDRAARKDVVLIAELVALDSLPLNQPLPFPTFDGRGTTFLGWRGDESPGTVTGVEAAPLDILTRDFLTPVGLGQLAPTKAYRKLNARGAIRVSPVNGAWSGSQYFSWQLRPRRAEVTATAVLSTTRPASLVEWDVPAGLNMESVTGAGVRYWSKTGNRLQVWFADPRTAAEVVWRGAINRAAEFARFDAPMVRLLQADVTTSLSVDAGPGWELAPVAVMRATGVPGPVPAFRAIKPNYRLVLQPEPWARLGAFRMATDVMVVDDVATTQTTLSISTASRSVQRFGISLPIETPIDVSIDAAGGHVGESPSSLGRRYWVIEPPAVAGDTYQVTVTSRYKVGGLTTWSLPLPVVELSHITPADWEHQLRLRAGGWEVGESRGVKWNSLGVAGQLLDAHAAVQMHTESPAATAPVPAPSVEGRSNSEFVDFSFISDSAGRWAATLLILALIGPIISWLPGRVPIMSLDAPRIADKLS